MKVSYSRISCYASCPYQYYIRYILKATTYPNQDANNALYLGTACHVGIQEGISEMLENYYSNYYIQDDLQINEMIKLQYLIPKIRKHIPDGIPEVTIEGDKYIGYIDWLVPVGKDEYDIYDFKYSNNIDGYMKSAQLHLYKYYFEKYNPSKRIRNLYFVFIPKTQIRQKKTEDIYQFRQRLLDTLSGLNTDDCVKKVTYDPKVVDEYFELKDKCLNATNYEKNKSALCNFCAYKDFCETGSTLDFTLDLKGEDEMIALPKNERRNIEISKKKKIWIYGAPFSGKSTLVDKFPDLLVLSTDGNVGNITAPYLLIKDEVTQVGREINRKYAWEVFKDIITELELKNNEFKSISIDLLEDLREMCRVYMYNKLNIQHESDSGFGKAYDVIKTEFLSTIKRFFNLNYENLVIVSHEDVSKNITKQDGSQITRIAPNLQEGLCTKIAGMVDIVGRVVVVSENDRILSFKANNVVFGGGRLNVTGQEIPLDYDSLMKIYDEVEMSGTNELAAKPVVETAVPKTKVRTARG